MNPFRSSLARFGALLFVLTLPRSAAAQEFLFSTVAGDPGYGSKDGTGSAARFNLPGGVAADSDGNVFVADTANHTIRKITAAGVVTTLAGRAGRSGSVNGAGSAARFKSPGGVAVDAGGNVFVADTGNHTIRMITAGGVVTTLAGSAGNLGSADGAGGVARFNNPTSLAVDAAGAVYVADTWNHRIRKITAGGIVSTLAGSFGSADGTGSAAGFKYPRGVALDRSGNVFVADTGNYAIRKITADGVVTTPPTSNEQIYYPLGLAVDVAGNIFVAESDYGDISEMHSIRKISASGAVTTFAGSYSSGNADGTGSSATFFYPTAVAVDGGGNVFVADTNNHTIRKITAGGVVTTFAGEAGYGSRDGAGSVARFDFRYGSPGAAVDGSGNVFVADAYNQTIRKMNTDGVVTTLAGLAETGGSADGTGSTARFFNPSGVAVDTGGSVFVADQANHTIRKITTAGVVTTLAGSALNPGSADGTGSAARFDSPGGVAVDGSGNVFVADSSNSTIRKITPGGVITTLAGSAGERGIADGTASAARFNYPGGVAVDASGNVFAADTSAHSIRKITADGVVTTLAGTYVPGSADGTGTAARFSWPRGVAVDSHGNVFVTDSGNQTIRKITPSGVVTTVAGSAGHAGAADGTGSTARFSYPYGIAVDANGNLFVVDAGNNTIRKGVPVPDTAPAITIQPWSQTVALGRTVAFNAAASGTPSPTYQWTRDGIALAGATGATLILSATTDADTGTYQCIVTNDAGSATSDAVTLTIASTPDVGRISNFSVRANLATGRPLIAGLVVSGGAKSVLMRGIGPELEHFLPTGTTLAGDPRLTLFDDASLLIQANDNWGGTPAIDSASAAVGAFPLFASSLDAALLGELSGPYTAHFIATSDGIGLLEVYDADIGSAVRFVNISARTYVGTGDAALIAGFVITGTTSQTVLIRGVGSALAAPPFNLPWTLADPELEIFDTAGGRVTANDDRSSSITSFGAGIGAFALSTGGKDAAVLVTLPPGVYTAVLTGAEDDEGEGLIEVYEVP